MTKKKSSGSTMTLKDFHGGSIPSVLPLPSAPGVVPRPATDRPSYDRASLGNSLGRLDQRPRPRPSSSHSIRNFDDKTPFLPHTANIGRNFSEDERKPLDGPSAPRRIISDNVFRAPSTPLEVKLDSVLAGKLVKWQRANGPLPVKKIDAAHPGIGSQMTGENNDNSVSGANANVWASRRAITPPSSESGQYPWATQPAVSKLIHVTAVEQVSSGRWHLKLVAPGQIENLKHPELESGLHKTNNYALDRGDVARERESSDVMFARHMETGLGIEDGILVRRKVSPEYEKGPAPAYIEVEDGNVAAGSNNRLYPNRFDTIHGVSAAQPAVLSEAMERPKLKLLPRTKPLENAERPLNDAKLESGASSVVVQRETGNLAHKNMNNLKPSSSADESGNQQAERRKLNLKPISQLLEQPDVKPERETNAVFGGARPRELVLKERGIDETAHHELEQQLDISRDMRTGKTDKKDNRSLSNAHRSETQRRNWRNNDGNNNNNNWKNNSKGENERQPQQQSLIQEKRHASPETWRKPASEPQKPESLDGMGQRGKAASAMELAQAFSKPFSDSRTGNNSFNNAQRGGFSGHNQVPFSRLTGPTPTQTPTPRPRQINGY